MADHFCSSFGYNQIGGKWIELQTPEHINITKWIITSDIAYGGGIALDEADGIVEELFGTFNDKCTCLTNSYYEQELKYFINKKDHLNVGQWVPLTSATFDTGIFITDRKIMCLVVSSAED